MTTEHRDADEVGLSFGDLRDTGVLWAINRFLFHPLGFALAVEVADGTGEHEEGTPLSWSLQGDGTECWSFKEADDDDRFAKFHEFLNAHRARGRPLQAGETFDRGPQ